MLKKLELANESINRFFTVRRILFVSFCFALLWMMLYQYFCVEIYRDVATCYAWYSREFGRGVWHSIPISKLPPLNIFLGGLLVRCGFEAYHAQQFLGSLFFALTIFPLFTLLKNFLSEKASAWGCFLFIMAPKLIRFSGMGLLESARDLFLVSAIALLFRFWNSKVRFSEYILFGLSLGLLAMARGEGCVMAGLLFLGLLIRPFRDYLDIKEFFKKIVFPCLIAAVSALIMVSPRLIETWKLTGYPVIDTRSVGVLKAIPFSEKLFHNKLPASADRIDPVWENAKAADGTPAESAAVKYTPFSFAEHLLHQMLRGGYEIYLAFSAIGLLVLLWKRRWRKEYSFLILFSLTVSWIIGLYSMAYRYFVFLIPLLMVFTLNGMIFILELFGRFHLRFAASAGVAVLALAQTQNAWGELLDQESAFRDWKMAQYLRSAKERFLPAGGKHRKLIVFSCDLPGVIFYTDEDRLAEYGEYYAPTQASEFDVLICSRAEKNQCTVLLARKDLVEVQHPFQQHYLLMTLKKNERQ